MCIGKLVDQVPYFEAHWPVRSWAVHEEIPFIRALRSIPMEVRRTLPAHYLKALDTQVRIYTMIPEDH